METHSNFDKDQCSNFSQEQASFLFYQLALFSYITMAIIEVAETCVRRSMSSLSQWLLVFIRYICLAINYHTAVRVECLARNHSAIRTS